MRLLLPSYLETNKGNLHGQDGAQTVDCAVGHVDAVRESARQHQNQDVKGDEVDQKHVAAPGGHLGEKKKQKNTIVVSETLGRATGSLFTPTYHVKVGQSTNRRPVH